MSLASFTMYVRPKKTLALRGHSGRLINGLVYTLLDEVAPVVAAEEHAPPVLSSHRSGEEPLDIDKKPKSTRRINGFTTSWVQGAFHREGSDVWATPDELYKIRFTTLREPVYHALGAAVIRRLTEGRGVGIGVSGETQDNFRIERLGLAPHEHDPWVALSDYEAIWRASEGGRRTVRLCFASPTAFQAGKLQSLFPTPASVFHGLLLKWNAFTPLAYKLTPEGWDTLEQQVGVSRYELRTDVIRAGKFMLKGFMGWVEYDLKEASPEVAHTIEVLSRYALFAGVGKKTTQGMGQCRAELG